MYHEWWGLPLFFLQTTSDVWHKIICKRFGQKKELRKTYHYVLKMCKDQSPLGDYCKYKVYFANLFLNYCKFERLNLNLLIFLFYFFKSQYLAKKCQLLVVGMILTCGLEWNTPTSDIVPKKKAPPWRRLEGQLF